MSIYKFLNKEDLPLIFESHTFVISTPQYFADKFAMMEVKDPQINDPNEATTIGIHDPIINRNVADASDSEKRILAALGIGTGAEQVTVFNNRWISTHRQCFIFSYAKGFFPDIKAALTGPPANYDACIKISRPREMIRQFMLSGRWGTKPLRETFSYAVCDRVRYDHITYNIGRDQKILPDPFRKERVFSHQNECRAVFYPHALMPEQRIIITLDHLTDFISLHPL